MRMEGMDMIKFERRKMKNMGKYLVQLASSSASCLDNGASLSVALNPLASSGLEDVSADGFFITTVTTMTSNSNNNNKSIDDKDDSNVLGCENGGLVSSKQLSFKYFKRTYQRRRGRNCSGGNLRNTHNDELYLITSAVVTADRALFNGKASSHFEPGESSAEGVLKQHSCCWEIEGLVNEVEPTLLEDGVPGFSLVTPSMLPRPLNLHDPLNFKLMEKLKSFLKMRGCNLPSGWSVQHKVCSCYGTHRYFSPESTRFTSMTAVLNHLKKLKDGCCFIALVSDLEKPQGINQLSSVSACPHYGFLLVRDVAPQAFAKGHVAANRDKMKNGFHQDPNASQERTGFLVNGGCMDQKQMLDGSPSKLSAQSQPEQTEKTYVCSGCGGKGADADNFLVCDGCEAAYHVHCLASCLNDVPTGSWYCTSCTASGRASPSSSPQRGQPTATTSIILSASESACKYDHCLMCEGPHNSRPLPLRRVLERKEQVDEHADCAVCERLTELRQTGHHCIVCERLHNLAQQHMQEAQTQGIYEGVAKKSDLQEADEQKTGACNVCRTGEKNDQGMAACANEYCFSRYYHIGCMRPPLGEEPPRGWYCPSCLCRACLVNENDDRIVLCDGCDEGYHTYCVKPSLPRVPKGKWYCTSCQEKRTQSRNWGPHTALPTGLYPSLSQAAGARWGGSKEGILRKRRWSPVAKLKRIERTSDE